MKTKKEVYRLVNSAIDSINYVVKKIDVYRSFGFFCVDIYVPIVNKRLLELLSDRFDTYITVLPCDDISVRVSFNIF